MEQTHLDLQPFLSIVQFITAGIVIPGTVSVVRILWGIKEHLARLNGHVAEHQQRWTDHDKRVESDDRHEEQIRVACATLHAERLAHLQENIEQLWGRIGERRRNVTGTD